jgi:hypothetical protein
MTHDDAIETIASALRTSGVIACVQGTEHGSHVGWGNKHRPGKPIAGVQRIVLQDSSTYDIIGTVTLDTQPTSAEHFNMGYAQVRPGRTCTTRWRMAEGYVNGFSLHDILWYAITRHRSNHRWYKERWSKKAMLQTES